MLEENAKKIVDFLTEKFGNEYCSYTYKVGVCYAKILHHGRGDQSRGWGSAYGFVDKEGNIYFPNGKTPKKPSRGHINNLDKCCERYNVIYLRG